MIIAALVITYALQITGEWTGEFCSSCETGGKAECPKLPTSPVVVQTEAPNFKGPKTQELVKFRKAIENHDFTLVKSFIEDNPRFLVSSGDTPQILQEGEALVRLQKSPMLI